MFMETPLRLLHVNRYNSIIEFTQRIARYLYETNIF